MKSSQISERNFRPGGLHPTALEVLRSPELFDPSSPHSIVTSHLRAMQGSALPEAIPIDEDAVVDHWVDYYVGRILDKKDTVTIVDGEPGEGKSTFTLWFAAKIRAELGKEMGTARTLDLDSDVVYRLSTFIHRVRLSSRADPSLIIVDEGVMIGAQGTSGVSDAGAILDRVLSVARIQACSIFVLHPSVWGLASFVRNRRAKVFLHVEQRGLTTAFTLKSSLEFTPPKQLPFKKARQPWAKIRWGSLESDPVWEPYESRKLETTKQMLLDSEAAALKLEKKGGLRMPGPWAKDHWGDMAAGRAPGETPEEYHRRSNRGRMQAARASTRAGGSESSSRTRARAGA